MTPSEKDGRLIGMLLSELTQEDIQRERDEVLSTTLESQESGCKVNKTFTATLESGLGRCKYLVSRSSESDRKSVV